MIPICLISQGHRDRLLLHCRKHQDLPSIPCVTIAHQVLIYLLLDQWLILSLLLLLPLQATHSTTITLHSRLLHCRQQTCHLLLHQDPPGERWQNLQPISLLVLFQARMMMKTNKIKMTLMSMTMLLLVWCYHLALSDMVSPFLYWAIWKRTVMMILCLLLDCPSLVKAYIICLRLKSTSKK